MLTILHLFGRSPFAPLQSHMELVAHCVNKVPELFMALERQDFDQLEKIAQQVSEFEHQADLTKNDIRNHLPKTLYMPMNRGDLLEILGIQDSIADKAEDIAILLTLRPLILPEIFKANFNAFLAINIETFNVVHRIIKELQDLLESSFGGIEAEKVRALVDDVAFKEHEADIIQRKLLKSLYRHDDQMSYTVFHLWQKILETTGEISNLSEKLAHRIRMTLDVK